MAAPSLRKVPDTSSLLPRTYIVFYDGECGLCQRSVRWLLDHDPYQRLAFAPLQGRTAARLRAQHVPLPAQLESVALLVQSDPRPQVFLRTRAFLELCRILEVDPWWARLLHYVPVNLADIAYRILARLRYRLFGRATACPWRTPEEAQRFLE
ncbi:MAG: thiol-disulfide oxidoreductase [Candidatus Binatia bacterium]|nr:MAG: thiol-disulfide oxidoreductase [Candidatus Binatia bacterium]